MLEKMRGCRGRTREDRQGMFRQGKDGGAIDMEEAWRLVDLALAGACPDICMQAHPAHIMACQGTRARVTYAGVTERLAMMRPAGAQSMSLRLVSQKSPGQQSAALCQPCS